jgi:hypothetical protein
MSDSSTVPIPTRSLIVLRTRLGETSKEGRELQQTARTRLVCSVGGTCTNERASQEVTRDYRNLKVSLRMCSHRTPKATATSQMHVRIMAPFVIGTTKSARENNHEARSGQDGGVVVVSLIVPLRIWDSHGSRSDAPAAGPESSSRASPTTGLRAPSSPNESVSWNGRRKPPASHRQDDRSPRDAVHAAHPG